MRFTLELERRAGNGFDRRQWREQGESVGAAVEKIEQAKTR